MVGVLAPLVRMIEDGSRAGGGKTDETWAERLVRVACRAVGVPE